jgi:hypothetical protein
VTDISAAYHDLLTDKKAFAHLVTIMPEGSPQVTPGMVRLRTPPHANQASAPIAPIARQNLPGRRRAEVPSIPPRAATVIGD